MRTSAKILRTIGRWLMWLGAAYPPPRHLGPWYHHYNYAHYYRYPIRSDER